MDSAFNEIRENLSLLYGPELMPLALTKLRDVISKQSIQISQVESQPGSGYELTEKDIIMIAYGDHFTSLKSTPLRTLANWCDQHLKGLISAVHLLPFHPSTSYDGYAITDYMAVDPRLGTWDDVNAFRRAGFSLMCDLVLNHCSQSHPWFKQFLTGQKPGCDYFISKYIPDAHAWLANVKRARNLPLLSRFDNTHDGTARHVWTTYHRDLVDLDWSNPDVCAELIRILVDTVACGFRFVRLDAFAYVWKKEHTSCVNQPETKFLLRLIRACLEVT